MAVTQMADLVQNGLDRAVEMMALAAHNGFRFKDRNTVKILAVGNERARTDRRILFFPRRHVPPGGAGRPH